MLISSDFTTNLFTIVIALTATILIYYKWYFSYWKRKGVETIQPSIPFGNIGSLIFGQKYFGDLFREFYSNFKQKGLPYGGIFMWSRNALIPIDTDIIKCVLQKDFDNFMNHGVYVDEEVDPLSANLFSLEDAKWRNLRVKLTPTFTSGKMKMMFETFANCTVDLVEKLKKNAVNQTPVDVKEVLSCFTTDIIGSVAFGLDCNAQNDPNSEFRKFGKKLTANNVSWRNFVAIAFPQWLLHLIRFKITHPEVEAFILKLVEDTINYREKNNVYRKDFMQLLIQLKNDAKVNDGDEVSLNQIAAQVFIFFMAGFETSSATMTFALFEISQNLEIQKKLREEINKVLEKYDNKLCYNAIMDMTYMDKVVNETLRKYPPIGSVSRVCSKDYKIPGYDLIIEKDTFVAISVTGLHYDEEYYPNPDIFDPERFNDENKASRPSCTWLPFGDGPRICIGSRFALMQTKVGLATMLQNFEISLNKKTVLPFRYNPRTVVLTAMDNVWLDYKQI